MKKIIQPLRFVIQAVFIIGLFWSVITPADVVGQYIWLSAVLFGVFFCGWCCPFGTIQAWIWRGARRLHIPVCKISPRAQKYLQLSRYLFYALSFIGISFFFLNARYYFSHNLIYGMIDWRAGGVLVFFLLTAVFIERPFCNYFCLKGAADGLMSVLRPVSIARQAEKCVHCHLCSKSCPMHILVEKTRFMRHPSCINCFKCVSVCPKNCLSYRLVKLKDIKKREDSAVQGMTVKKRVILKNFR